ncbi:MAG: hypothetical protein KatS3mg068_0434 [Candidatus Sericytochromatia bacterium]|nr:MAG: hypothetical protein KatS3mg068_0434 [Candidatus Sericytochromatia bacterium]
MSQLINHLKLVNSIIFIFFFICLFCFASENSSIYIGINEKIEINTDEYIKHLVIEENGKIRHQIIGNKIEIYGEKQGNVILYLWDKKGFTSYLITINKSIYKKRH